MDLQGIRGETWISDGSLDERRSTAHGGMFERVPACVVYDTEQEDYEEWLGRETLQPVGEHLLRRVKRCVQATDFCRP